MRRILIACLLAVSVLLQGNAVVADSGSMTLYPVADNYADSKYPKLGHYGTSSVLYVGNSYDRGQNIWGSERIYIRFNLTEIPKNRVIVKATLCLWQFYAPESNQTYEAHRVLGDWDEVTQNWENQPSWLAEKTSQAIAPDKSEVLVQWDITNDAKAWRSGQAPNYGTMIKAAKEEHAADASSGFWARGYLVGSHEEWRPRLVIVLQGEPTSTYVVTVGVTGLANGTASTITLDGQPYGNLHLGGEEKITLDRGTTHRISVSEVVSGSQGVRYRCAINEIQVSAATSHTFEYTVEYMVTSSMEPSNLFVAPPTGWYAANTTIAVKRIGSDIIDTGQGSRLVFDSWYLNSHRLETEPAVIVVTGPMLVEGRYTIEYHLNVTSAIGKTQGSGWYAKDSPAAFSIDRLSIREEGVLGLLGLRRSFVRWSGSNNFLGLPVEPQGSIMMKEPTTIQALWEDDYSSLIVSVVVAFFVIAITCVTLVVATRRHRRRITRKTRK